MTTYLQLVSPLFKGAQVFSKGSCLSLAKEFKVAGSPEEKRELLNSILNKLRQIGEEQVCDCC
jgi:hypothetical protein